MGDVTVSKTNDMLRIVEASLKASSQLNEFAAAYERTDDPDTRKRMFAAQTASLERLKEASEAMSDEPLDVDKVLGLIRQAHALMTGADGTVN